LSDGLPLKAFLPKIVSNLSFGEKPVSSQGFRLFFQ
jgi:hypothetical protein